MPKYVIWFEFDDVFTAFCREKCKELDRREIEPGVRPPHLTLTFVETAYPERLIHYTKTFFQRDICDIMVGFIGLFAGGVLFLAPQVSRELLEVHNDFCRGVQDSGVLAWDLYTPGNWTPHIALTGELDDDAASQALSVIRSGFSPAKARPKRVIVKNCADGETILDLLL